MAVLLGVIKNGMSAVRSTLVLSRSRVQRSGMHCAMNAIHAASMVAFFAPFSGTKVMRHSIAQ